MSWKNRGPMFCRSCEAHQVKTEIYFDNEHKSQTSGKSIPMEKATRQPHQCQFSPYAMKQNARQEQKEFIDNRGYMEQPKQQYKTTSPYEQLPPEKYVAEPQNYGEYFKVLEAKIDSIKNTLDEFLSDATNTENRILRETLKQLEQVVANHEKSFTPANKMDPRDIEPEALRAEAENEHVRRVMRKGEEDEELEI